MSGAKRLEADGLGTLELTEANGYIVTNLDLGFPEVRAVTQARINAHGVDDSTALLGARAVTFTVACFAPDDGSLSKRDVLARLRAYANPAYRPALIWSEDDGVEQRVVLRGEPPTWPLTAEGVSTKVQMAFTAPSGLLETFSTTAVVVPAVTFRESGRAYPLAYPRQYSAAAPFDAVTVANGGLWNASVDHVTQLWGPCIGPRLLNVTSGTVLALPGLTLADDQYAEVNTREATIQLNGRVGESLYSWQEWGTSSFWQLTGGANLLRYSPDSFGAAARAVVTYRTATL
ncbi:hypothetical protein [Enterococcus hirae]|uniref:hypothetical protein n=1 Tax=Enterococcus hirae TaxID=1354 RepID=UPI00136B9DC7|nr:hypothetical protein [Enterococcus hirae]NAE18057.1 hypothetical protein [Enterococcus hirae]